MERILEKLSNQAFKEFKARFKSDGDFKQMVIDFFVAGKGMDDIDWCDGCPYKSYRP